MFAKIYTDEGQYLADKKEKSDGHCERFQARAYFNDKYFPAEIFRYLDKFLAICENVFP